MAVIDSLTELFLLTSAGLKHGHLNRIMAATATVPEIPLKLQTWGEDLRLPCITDIRPVQPSLEPLRELQSHSVPFQSKHLPALKRNNWFALRRPKDRSRSGLLCVVPELQACIYISGEPTTNKRPGPRMALLRVRVDPTFLAPGCGATVFSATLSATARRLWIEDVVQWKGRRLHEETFPARWRLVTQWIEHYCMMDVRLLGGLEIEAAPWQPLSAVQPEGVWELQSDDPGRRRLLWIANMDEPSASAASSATTASAASTVTVPHLDVTPNTGPPIATAVRESGPDQWSLINADGSSLGKALIRRLDISSALRSAKMSSVKVEIAWMEEFGKWEIKAVVK